VAGDPGGRPYISDVGEKEQNEENVKVTKRREDKIVGSGELHRNYEKTYFFILL
jgi:hypothetical protein